MVTTVAPSKARSRARIGLVLLLVAAAIVAGFAMRAAAEQRENDRRVDRYYCTMSNVGPLDRAPQTGERCIDVIEKGY